jgi:putative ABC transport system permease protein
MNLVTFALKDLRRRPTRAALTALGVAVAALCLFTVLSFDRGYDRALREEMARSGAHMYVSTEGCPLEAASLILHGGEIPRFLPERTVEQLAQVQGIRAAAPMLIFAAPVDEGKLDLFYGVDKRIVELRPYWTVQGKWPEGKDEILLGAETAKVEKRNVGDRMYFPSIDREFRVAGILERTGTQDDSFYFLPLATLQEVFHKPKQLTAVAVAVQDLTELSKVESRIKEHLPDVYVVTERQMTEEIIRLTGGSKALMYSIVVIAILVSVLGILNTVLMSVFEKMREFGYMRCVGATHWDIFRLVAVETVLVCTGGAALGVIGGAVLASASERFAREILPYAPAGALMHLDWQLAAVAVATTVLIGAVAGLLPGIKAARVSPMEVVRHE